MASEEVIPKVDWPAYKLREILEKAGISEISTHYLNCRLPVYHTYPQPSCCGLTIIHAFDSNSWSLVHRCYGDGRYSDGPEKKWDVAIVAAWLCLQLRVADNRPCCIATTNPTQAPVAALLEKIGFNEIHQFVNPNTGNTIKVWMARTRP